MGAKETQQWVNAKSNPVSKKANALTGKAFATGHPQDHARAAEAHAKAAGAAFARGDSKAALAHAAKRAEHEKSAKR